MWQVFDFRKEFIRQNGDVRLLQARGREDVDHFVRSHGLGHDLSHCRIEVFGAFAPGRLGLGETRTNSLKEADIIPNCDGSLMRH